MPPAGPGPWRLSGALLPLVLVLSGCSGTRFGESLSRSFSAAPAPEPAQPGKPAATAAGSSASRPAGSTPAATSPAPATAGSPSPAPAAASPRSSSPTSQVGATVSEPAARPSGSAAAGSSLPGSRPPTGRPAPYRVTILLPQADAAAPAEVVTQALRAAGVPFEVETIERVSGARSAATGAAPAASVRPAPEPR